MKLYKLYEKTPLSFSSILADSMDVIVHLLIRLVGTLYSR